jgi:hypothetical protein
MEATEARETPEETFANDPIGVTSELLACALKAGHS